MCYCFNREGKPGVWLEYAHAPTHKHSPCLTMHMQPHTHTHTQDPSLTMHMHTHTQQACAQKTHTTPLLCCTHTHTQPTAHAHTQPQPHPLLDTHTHTHTHARTHKHTHVHMHAQFLLQERGKLPVFSVVLNCPTLRAEPPARPPRPRSMGGSMVVSCALAVCGAFVAAFTALGHRKQPRLFSALLLDLPLQALHFRRQASGEGLLGAKDIATLEFGFLVLLVDVPSLL